MTVTCSTTFAVTVAIGCLFSPAVGIADTSDSTPKLVLNAKDYGATGDGKTDDDAALNRALAAAARHGPGTELLIPAGTYCLGVARPLGLPEGESDRRGSLPERAGEPIDRRRALG